MSAWLAAVRDNGKLLLCALGIIFFYVQYDIHIEALCGMRKHRARPALTRHVTARPLNSPRPH